MDNPVVPHPRRTEQNWHELKFVFLKELTSSASTLGTTMESTEQRSLISSIVCLIANEAGEIESATPNAEFLFQRTPQELISESIQNILDVSQFAAGQRGSQDVAEGADEGDLAAGFAIARGNRRVPVWVRRTSLVAKRPSFLWAVHIAPTQIDRTSRVDDSAPDEKASVVSELDRAENERTAAEYTFQNAEMQIRTIMSTVPEFIMLWDREAKLLFLNRLAPGYTLSQAIGHSAFEFIDPKYHEITRQSVEGVFKTGQVTKFESEACGANGELRWYMNRFAPVYDGDKISSALVVATDITEQKIVELELKASEMRFRTIFEQASDGMLIGNSSGILTEVNSAACAMFGYSPDELRSKSVFELIAKDDLDRAKVELARLNHGSASLGEWQFVRKDQSRFYGEANAKQLPDQRIIASVRDISVRKQAHLMLLSSEELLREFIRHAPVAIAMLDTNLRYLQASDCWYKDYDLLGQQIIGKSHFEVFPELPERWREIYRRALTGRIERSNEDMFVRKDGAVEWLEWEIRPWRKPSGEIGGIVVFAQFITDRKYIQEKLQESQSHLLASQRVAGVGSWELDLGKLEDPDANSLRWSDECFRVFGYQPGEVEAGNPAFWARVHPDDRSKIVEAVRRAIDNREVYELEHRIVLPSGEERVIFERAELVLDAVTNVPIKFIGTSQDISNRVKLEEQLRKSQKLQAIGQLAGGVAHDFNNLLTVINGYSNLLLDTMNIDDENHEAVVAIRDAGERAANLTRQLLLFSRKAILSLRVLDLNDVLENSAALLRSLIGEDIHLSLLLSPNIWKVKGDQSQIDQVVMNLSINARDAMPEGGKLLIETRNVTLTEEQPALLREGKPGRHVHLIVSDSGMGMSQETMSHLFEPFFTTKGPGKGTGLGLATVYGVVHASGGFITVQSELGSGTTFNIYLPAVFQTEEVHPTDTVAGSQKSAGERILLVEDDEEVRKIAKRSLESSGYTVYSFESGIDAIAWADDNLDSIDLLITDVVMPAMNGRQVAEAMLLRIPSLRILFMSGYNDDAIIRHGIDEERNPFLQKPFSPASLAQKVREVLNR